MNDRQGREPSGWERVPVTIRFSIVMIPLLVLTAAITVLALWGLLSNQTIDLSRNVLVHADVLQTAAAPYQATIGNQETTISAMSALFTQTVDASRYLLDHPDAQQTAVAPYQATIDNQKATISAMSVLSTARPAPSVPDSPNRLVVVVRGADNLLYYKFSLNGGWTDWQSFQPPLVGMTIDEPVVVPGDNGRVDLFVRGNDDKAYHATFDGEQWSTWESLDGVLTSGPGAALIR